MSKIEIQKISITNIKADAVVNAANSGLWEGGGVCGYIFQAAGSRELKAECDKYPNGCPTGQAVITSSCKMKTCKYIIHAVGPCTGNPSDTEKSQLYDAYKNSLQLAMDNGCHSIAFPLISTGIFHYPVDDAWKRALRACVNFQKKHPDYELDVYFAILDPKNIAVGQKTLAKILAE